MNWQTMDSAPRDGSQIMLYCPGAVPSTKGVVIGGWLARLSVWELLPYGTTQPVTLYPSMWAPVPAGPTG